MARALWLPAVLRGAGLDVREVGGWETRGGDSFDPRGVICHATAGSRTATDAGEIAVLLNGSATAPAPIAQLYLSRTGTFHVVASGRCNHALTGWAGPLAGLGNTNLLGVEAANDNRGEPWPAVQLDAYARGVAAICAHMGWTTARVAGHKEHQPYPPPAGQTSTKTDPTFDMATFRNAVAYYLNGGSMALTDADVMKIWTWDLVNGPDVQQAYEMVLEIRNNLREVKAGQAQIMAALAALGSPPPIPPVDVAELEAANERAVRRVLGSLDVAA